MITTGQKYRNKYSGNIKTVNHLDGFKVWFTDQTYVQSISLKNDFELIE